MLIKGRAKKHIIGVSARAGDRECVVETHDDVGDPTDPHRPPTSFRLQGVSAASCHPNRPG